MMLGRNTVPIGVMPYEWYFDYAKHGESVFLL